MDGGSGRELYGRACELECAINLSVTKRLFSSDLILALLNSREAINFYGIFLELPGNAYKILYLMLKKKNSPFLTSVS